MKKAEPKGVVDEIARLKNTTTWSLEGLRHAWKTEKSLRQWFGVNIGSLVALFALDVPLTQWALVIAMGLLVLVAELFNSAIESIVDLASPEIHPLAKAAKDTASAGVFVTAIAFGVVWVLTLILWMQG